MYSASNLIGYQSIATVHAAQEKNANHYIKRAILWLNGHKTLYYKDDGTLNIQYEKKFIDHLSPKKNKQKQTNSKAEIQARLHFIDNTVIATLEEIIQALDLAKTGDPKKIHDVNELIEGLDKTIKPMVNNGIYQHQTLAADMAQNYKNSLIYVRHLLQLTQINLFYQEIYCQDKIMHIYQERHSALMTVFSIQNNAMLQLIDQGTQIITYFLFAIATGLFKDDRITEYTVKSSNHIQFKKNIKLSHHQVAMKNIYQFKNLRPNDNDMLLNYQTAQDSPQQEADILKKAEREYFLKQYHVIVKAINHYENKPMASWQQIDRNITANQIFTTDHLVTYLFEQINTQEIVIQKEGRIELKDNTAHFNAIFDEIQCNQCCWQQPKFIPYHYPWYINKLANTLLIMQALSVITSHFISEIKSFICQSKNVIETVKNRQQQELASYLKLIMDEGKFDHDALHKQTNYQQRPDNTTGNLHRMNEFPRQTQLLFENYHCLSNILASYPEYNLKKFKNLHTILRISIQKFQQHYQLLLGYSESITIEANHLSPLKKHQKNIRPFIFQLKNLYHDPNNDLSKKINEYFYDIGQRPKMIQQAIQRLKQKIQ